MSYIVSEFNKEKHSSSVCNTRDVNSDIDCRLSWLSVLSLAPILLSNDLRLEIPLTKKFTNTFPEVLARAYEEFSNYWGPFWSICSPNAKLRGKRKAY